MGIYQNVTLLFFFSSRRRHTRCSRDWSSDVCSSDLSCIAVLGNTNAGSPPGLSAAVQISNNTLYDCGARQNPDSGGMTTGTSGAIAVAMNNNILFSLPGETYFTGSSKTANVTGSNNL